MGNRPVRQKLSSKDRETSTNAELTRTYSGQESTWEESVEIHQCCGIKVEKIKRSNINLNLEKIVWEDNFIDNCQSIANEFGWANDLIDLVGNCELAKTKYFIEVNMLKNEAKVEQPTETEILHTPAEV
jgi:hypothetical protein